MPRQGRPPAHVPRASKRRNVSKAQRPKQQQKRQRHIGNGARKLSLPPFTTPKLVHPSLQQKSKNALLRKKKKRRGYTNYGITNRNPMED